MKENSHEAEIHSIPSVKVQYNYTTIKINFLIPPFDLQSSTEAQIKLYANTKKVQPHFNLNIKSKFHPLMLLSAECFIIMGC